MKNYLFIGSGVALVTPFVGEKIDFSTLEKLIEFQIANKTAAIISCGTTGEPATMSKKEQESVIKFTIEKVNGRIPVIAGTGGNNTKEVIDMAKISKKLGASGQLCVTPYYNKTTQRGLIHHYKAIADSTDLPIILYNVPARTGLNMLPETVAELAEHENIVGLKEASGDIDQIIRTVALSKGKIAFYSGCDEILFPLLSLGYSGVISVAANILPLEMQDLATSFFDGRIKEGFNLQIKMNPLIYELFKETNPAPVKAALSMMKMGNGYCRMPLVQLEEKNRISLEKELQEYGLIG